MGEAEDVTIPPGLGSRAPPPVAAIWSVERLLETCPFTSMTMLVFHPFAQLEQSLPREFLSTALLPFWFYGLTGYVISCVTFGMHWRSPTIWHHVIKMTAVFSAHGLSFLWGTGALTGDHDGVGGLRGYVLLGIVSVAIANSIGAILAMRHGAGNSTFDNPPD